MSLFYDFIKKDFRLIGGIVFVLFSYWFILLVFHPYQLVQFFETYSLGLFLAVFLMFFLTFKLPRHASILLGLGFTLAILALTLDFKWETGYSDNFLIGGILPYKDAKNYFLGTNLIFNGLPLEKAGQATERPLFPGFLSSIFLFTGANLKLSLAILAQFAGVGLYYSSRRVFHSFGALSASLYSSLLFLYIQPWIGYTMSEIFGFTMGCVAFSLLWFVAEKNNWRNLVVGLVVLLIAVSARAGAFFIFPLLVVWVGWIYRGGNRFSVKASIYTFILIIAVYLSINTLFPRLVGVPKDSSFGNFAYAIYGQVRGGTGWHSAIEDLGTRDPNIVYQAAFDFFREHPLSLLIGFVKSYRDFFLPGHSTIFPFAISGHPTWEAYVIWFGTMGILLLGLYRLIKRIRMNLSSFILVGFVGMFLSIPFLPPVDGGGRFYASTVPFFFVVPAIGLSYTTQGKHSFNQHMPSRLFRSGAVVLILLTVISPLLIYFSAEPPKSSGISSCALHQEEYRIQIYPDSYLNFIQNESKDCGISPNICINDFRENNAEFKIDDFYQEVYAMAKTGEENFRLIPTINMLDRKFHYFFVEESAINEIAYHETISGCAVEVRTKNQSIYVIKSVSLYE